MAAAGPLERFLTERHEAPRLFELLTGKDLMNLRASRRLRAFMRALLLKRRLTYRPGLGFPASYRGFLRCREAFGVDDISLRKVPRQNVLGMLAQTGATFSLTMCGPGLEDLARLFNACGASLTGLEIPSSWGNGDRSPKLLPERVPYHSRTDLQNAGLTRLEGLRRLNLSGHLLIAPDLLESLTRLTELTLRRCQLTGDFHVATALRALTVLDVSHNAELHSVGDLPSLTSLNISGCSLHDPTGLAGLPGLTSLNISGNSLRSLAGLAGLPRLTSLDISGNGALGEQSGADPLAPLAGLTSLTDLSIAGCNLRRIDAPFGLPGIVKLNAADNPLSGEVCIPESLGSLDLDGWNMLLRAPAGGLGALTKLSCKGSLRENSLNALESAVNLRDLNISGMPMCSKRLLALLAGKLKLCELAILSTYVGHGAFEALAATLPPLVTRLTRLSLGCTDLGPPLFRAVVAYGQPLGALTALNLRQQIMFFYDMDVLAKALRLLSALEELHMDSCLESGHGVMTVLQNASKRTLIRLGISENKFTVGDETARCALETFMVELRTFEVLTEVNISDCGRTPFSLQRRAGPPPVDTIVGDPAPPPRRSMNIGQELFMSYAHRHAPARLWMAAPPDLD